MTVPVFTGPVPNRLSSPETFSADTDSYHAELGGVIAGMNATAIAMNLNSTTDTSSSSVVIGTGSKSLTVSPSKSFQGGMYVVVADTAAPSVNSMTAQISSYNSTTGALVIDVVQIRGSGTISAWTISQSSAPQIGIVPTTQGGTGVNAANLAALRIALDVPSNTEVMHSGYMQVQDQKASGVSGGASTVSAVTRTLNTVVSNTISGASLSSNIITLPAGTYRLHAESMAVADSTAGHITPYIQNTTDGVKALIGVRAYTGVGMAANPSVSGRFTIASTKTFTLVNQYSSANTNGLGLPASFGYAEVYANVEIWKE